MSAMMELLFLLPFSLVLLVTPLDVMDKLNRWFAGDTWASWRCVLASMFALPMTDEQRVLFARLTGRASPPLVPVKVCWWLMGRRSGKSLMAAFLAFVTAVMWRGAQRLAPGERAIVMLMAVDRDQAQVLMRYVLGFFSLPPFAAMIERQTQDAIYLKNGSAIEVHTRSFKLPRGRTVILFIGEESAFWSGDDSAAPDTEVLSAVKPSMATVPNALLLMISTLYARSGETFKAHSKHYGKDSDTLVFCADTRTMNPTVSQALIDEAFEEDPAMAAAEYGRATPPGVEFRSDVEQLLTLAAATACVVRGRMETDYRGEGAQDFTDFAMGSGSDSYAHAIAHAEERDGRLIGVLDHVCEVRPPFSPQQVLRGHSEELHERGITFTTGDQVAGEWAREQARALGIDYIVTKKSKSQLYLALVPRINSGTVELLDHPKLLAQLLGLERRPGRDHDSIDHRPNGHDDLINAAAGALFLAMRPHVPLEFLNGSAVAEHRSRDAMDQEQEARDLEDRERAKQVVDDQIAVQGCYWPGESPYQHRIWQDTEVTGKEWMKK